MDGRLQNELRIDEQINKMLKILPTYVTEWNGNMKASKKTASTRRIYIRYITNYIESINKNMKAVVPGDFTEKSVETFLISIQTKKDKNGNITYTSDSYQQVMWSCLKAFFDFMIISGYLTQNYVLAVKRPQNHDLDRINEHRVLLTENDFKQLINEVNKTRNPVRRARNKAMLLVLMNTGMRESAMISLMPDNIDFQNKMLYVIDKGNKRHQYVLTDDTVDALRDWMSVRNKMCRHDINVNNIFISHEGNQMAPEVVYTWLRKLSKKAIGRAISPHKIRSGLCSILYSETHDIEFVRRAIGHANVSTTQRYIVTNGSEKKKASDIIGKII